MTTITLDGVIFDGTLSHPLAYSCGLNWMGSISVGERAWGGGIACLMVDLQNLAKEFECGAVIADFDASLADLDGCRMVWKDFFKEELISTITDALPGLKSLDDFGKDRIDASLLLTIYGAASSRLSSYKIAHLIDAKVPGGKIAVLGERRGAINRLKGLISMDADRVGIDGVAAIALRTLETYTHMLENGDIEMSDARVGDILATMSHLKEGLMYAKSDCWAFSDESFLYRFDDIMDEFQKATEPCKIKANAA